MARILFALDNTDEHRTDYLRGNPSLEGRMLFVSSTPEEPSAAFIKMNEALGDEEQRIRQHVQGRYLIRTRADIPTEEADYPDVSPFGSGYASAIARCRTAGRALQPGECAVRLSGRMAGAGDCADNTSIKPALIWRPMAWR